MTEIKTTLSDLRTEIIEKIEEYNAALRENNYVKAVQVEQDLKDTETAYAEARSVQVFTELKAGENPLKNAVLRHSYTVLTHRAKRTEGVTTGFEIVEESDERAKMRQIDLVKFCKFCELPTDWQYKVEKFNQLLALRAANELKMTKTQMKSICDSFYMNELAKKAELGETPDSNTAICKQLQTILDDILFEDNGKGKNVYRVNNHDVAYLLMCYTKRGKKALSVAVAKHSYLHRLVLDVAHRVAAGKAYDLEYKAVSGGKVSEIKTKSVSPKKEALTETEKAPEAQNAPEAEVSKKSA